MALTVPRAAVALLVLAITCARAEAPPAAEEDRALEPVFDLLHDEPDDRAVEPEPPRQPLTGEEARQLTSLLRSAESGDRDAQYQVGKRHASGKGAPYDLAEARRWYQRAADNGNLDAANGLAVLLATGGRGVPRDPRQARRLLRQAAAGKHALALFNMGQQYRTGELFERDDPRAFRCFREAAELGLAAARTNVGTMYMEGIGVEPDPREAVRWWERAAEGDRPDARALYFLGLAYARGTPATPQSEATAEKYLRRAANLDYQPARKYLEEHGM